MPKPASIVSASADQNAMEVLQLIADYQRSVRATVAGLRRQTGANDLLAAWRRGRIPRTGALKCPRGRFTFHGAGCRFEVAHRLIDVEFGPRGRHDGFDAWRLHQFAASAFEWQYLTPQNIRTGLRQLEGMEMIRNPRDDSSPHLYYLAEDLDPPKRGRTKVAARL